MCTREVGALNYILLVLHFWDLVTKSSVPVVVSRKKHKYAKKVAKANVRQPNNLMTSAQASRLAGAKVDYLLCQLVGM